MDLVELQRIVRTMWIWSEFTNSLSIRMLGHTKEEFAVVPARLLTEQRGIGKAPVRTEERCAWGDGGGGVWTM